MIFLIPALALVVLVFGIAYFQSVRDVRRWQRIVSGRSLFGEREDLPPLVLGDTSIEPKNRPILVIWGDHTSSGYFLAEDARKQIARELRSGNSKAKDARMFAWDSKSWRPLAATMRY